jgi:DNA primase
MLPRRREWKSIAPARASEVAGVSTPIESSELERELRPQDFTLRTLFSTFAQNGDQWAVFHKARGVELAAVLDRRGEGGMDAMD